MKTTPRKCSTQFPIRVRALDVAVFVMCSAVQRDDRPAKRTASANQLERCDVSVPKPHRCDGAASSRRAVPHYPLVAGSQAASPGVEQTSLSAKRTACCDSVTAAAAARGLARQYFAFAPDDDPVRALLLVHIETLAVVAAHAFGHDDLRALDRAPLAGFLTQLASCCTRTSA